MLEQLQATKDTLKKRTMITKKELKCPGTKQNCDKILNDKHKQMGNGYGTES